VDFPVGSEQPSVATGRLQWGRKSRPGGDEFYANTVSVLLGQGGRHVQRRRELQCWPRSHIRRRGGPHWNQKLDLVVVNETDNNASVLLGNGDGTFNLKVAIPHGVGEILCRS